MAPTTAAASPKPPEEREFDSYMQTLPIELAGFIRAHSDGRVVRIPLDKIYDAFDVRLGGTAIAGTEHVNEERRIMFGDALKNNFMSVPPVLVERAAAGQLDVTGAPIPADGFFPDEGRHRVGGGRFVGVTEVRAIVMNPMGRSDRITLAIATNMIPGPLHMTREEIKRQAMNLALPKPDGCGVKIADIRKRFLGANVSSTLLNKILRDVDSDIDDINMRKAITEVTNSSLPAKEAVKVAAAKYGFKPATIMNQMHPDQRKTRQRMSQEFAGLSGGVGHAFDTVRKTIERTAQKATKLYLESAGEIDSGQVDDLFRKQENSARAVLRLVSRKRSQFKQDVQYGIVPEDPSGE